MAGLGEKVEAGQPLAVVHAQTEDQAEEAFSTILNAYEISRSAPESSMIVIERIHRG